jgi:hypothetical protein
MDNLFNSMQKTSFINDIEKVKRDLDSEMNLHYDHLIQRLEKTLIQKDNTNIYLDALIRYSEIPGFTISPQYKSFYQLLCNYNKCQTKTTLMSYYLDEFIVIVDDIINEHLNTEKWKKTPPQQ